LLTAAVWDAVDPILVARVPSPVWGPIKASIRDTLYLQYALETHKESRFREFAQTIMTRNDRFSYHGSRRWDEAKLLPALAGAVDPDVEVARSARALAIAVRGALEKFHGGRFEYIRQEDMPQFNRAMTDAMYSATIASQHEFKDPVCTRYIARLWTRHLPICPPTKRRVRNWLRRCDPERIEAEVEGAGEQDVGEFAHRVVSASET
jgi:hypothetical protein